MDATSHGDVERRRAKVLNEEATQMAAGDAEPVGKRFDARVIQSAVADEAKRARDEARCAKPGRCAGRRLGSTAQARPKPGGLRGGGRGEVSDVLVLGGSGGTNRPAIDACAGDGNEKPPIEACVARATRTIAHQLIELHLRRA